MTAGNDQSVLVGAIVAMAGKLGLTVVAEGIEQENEKDILVSCGCNLLQGHLLGHPAPPERITERLRAQTRQPGITENVTGKSASPF